MRILNISDMHLRHDKPICRLDTDWLHTQQKTVNYIVQTAVKHNCDYIVDNGDTFDAAVQPHTVINIIPNALKAFGKGIKWITMPGNHSLQFHQIKNFGKAALSTLNHCEDIIVLKDCTDEFEAEFLDIPIIHRLMFRAEEDIPWFLRDSGKGEHAQQLLDAYPHADLILTGDMHHNWHYENGGRHVVNPGCMLVQEVGMIGYIPKMALIDYEPNKLFELQWIDIPDDGELTSNEHLLKIKEADERIDTLMEKVKNPEIISLDFWDNMEKYLHENSDTIGKDVRDCIMGEIKPCKTH